MRRCSHEETSEGCAARSARRRFCTDGGSRRRLIRRTKRLHEGYERRHLGGSQILSVGRHVSSALQHLTDQLVTREPRRDAVKSWAALSAFSSQAVAIPALLVLDHDCAL